jgi:hypothetical protein
MAQAWNLTRFYPEVSDEEKLDVQKVEPGAWLDLNAIGRQLESIARNIDPGAPSLADVKSVPDPWAHPRSCAEAVLEKNHPLHEECVGQWRWLLAVIGLSGTRKHIYEVTFTSLDLTAGAARSSRIFADLAPKRSLWRRLASRDEGVKPLSDAAWTKPVLVTLVSHTGQKHEIGLLNPASLITSGRRYTEVHPDVSPGWISSAISDPTGSLTANEKRILSHYLTSIREDLDNLLGPTEDTDWGRLRVRLSDFIADCGMPGLELEVEAHPQADELARLYRPLALLPREQPGSDCRIAGTNLILADPAIASSLKRPLGEVRLWGQYSLSDLKTISGLLDQIAPVQNGVRAIPQHEFEIVTPDQLLAHRLYELDGMEGDAAFIRHGPSLSGFTLPVHPIAFQFIDPADVAASLKRKESKVELTVPLEADGAGVSLHEVTKEMDTVALTCREYQLSIWPNFRSNGWSDYFARLSPNVDTRSAQQHYLVPYDILSLESAPTEPVHVGDLDAEVVRHSARPVDAIVCAARTGGARRGDPAYAGLLLLAEPEALPDRPTRGVKVAVDFGTTGTIAMAEGDAVPVPFRERVLRPLGVSEEYREAVAWRLVDFFPVAWADAGPIAQRMPVLSAWLETDIWASAGGKVAGTPLFLPSQRAEEIPEVIRILGQIQSNLKWSFSLRQTALHYLLRLGLMIRAELAAGGRHVDRWVFTHPRSLRPEKLAQFKEDVGGAFAQTLPGPLPAEKDALARFIEDRIDFRCEDEACALSTFDAGDAGDTTVILDIGGRTTDATLIQRAGKNEGGFRRLWQGSLRIAGIAFFTKPITEDADLLEWLDLKGWGGVLTDVTDPELRPFRLELLMGGTTLDEKLKAAWIGRDEKRKEDRSGRKKANDIRLEVTTLTFLAGIAWYLGSVARELDRAKAELLGKVHFRLCGRGARFPLFLNQLGDYDRVRRALGMFHAGTGTIGSTVVRGGKRELKEEVAGGILIDRFDERILTGEAGTTLYHVAGVAAGDCVPVSAQDPMPIDTLPTIRPEAIERFLHDLRLNVGVAIDVDNLGERIAELPSQPQIDLAEEPAFIVCLRWLIESIADPKTCEGIGFRIERPTTPLSG